MPETLRKGVTHLVSAIWDYRGEYDAYLETNDFPDIPRPDHIIEIQVLDHCYFSTGPSAGTRHMKSVVNDLFNLNVTTKVVNDAKFGPIRTFMTRYNNGSLYSNSLNDFARKALKGRRLWIYEGAWNNIEGMMSNARDAIVAEVEDRPAYEPFIDELNGVFNAMGIK